MRERIPALIVSGFLGSGKTTLVRHQLLEAQATGRRLAVVSNEFGALGIDRALLGSGGEAYVELEGGCVCCQLSTELIDTLEMLRERVRPDLVIVETSGVALPSDIQIQFWREPVSKWVSGETTVVVVDAEQLLAGRHLEGTFEDQVTSADLLLLNKVDLVPENALPELEARLRKLEPDAPILQSTFGRVSAEVLFPPDPSAVRSRRPRAAPHGHEAFDARELLIEPGIAEEDLVMRLRELAALRVKGFVQTSRGVRLVQGVGARIQIGPAPEPPPAHLLGRLVLIERTSPQG